MLRHKGWCFYGLGIIFIAAGTFTLTREIGYSFLEMGIGIISGVAISGGAHLLDDE